MGLAQGEAWEKEYGVEKQQTPWERYLSRAHEVYTLRVQLAAKLQEINDELRTGQLACEHVDNDHILEGSCEKCGVSLG